MATPSPRPPSTRDVASRTALSTADHCRGRPGRVRRQRGGRRSRRARARGVGAPTFLECRVAWKTPRSTEILSTKPRSWPSPRSPILPGVAAGDLSTNRLPADCRLFLYQDTRAALGYRPEVLVTRDAPEVPGR